MVKCIKQSIFGANNSQALQRDKGYQKMQRTGREKVILPRNDRPTLDSQSEARKKIYALCGL